MLMTEEELKKSRNKLWNDIIIEDPTVCYHCKTKGLHHDDVFCPSCRFPQKGTQLEMKQFIIQVNRKHSLMHDKQKAIRKARIVLFFLSGANIFFGVMLANKFQDRTIFFTGFIMAVIYFALALWSHKNPFAAILSGFAIYLVSIGMNAVVDPNTLYHGIIWKIIFITAFVVGYTGAKDADKLAAEIDSLHETKDLSK